MGRRTFSAAMVNAIDFRKDTTAILVGAPIGERPNSYSENDEMTLPNSRVVVSYSTRYYQFLDQDVPAVVPDQRLDPSWVDFKAGRDPVMEWVLGTEPQSSTRVSTRGAPHPLRRCLVMTERSRPKRQAICAWDSHTVSCSSRTSTRTSPSGAS